MDSTLQPARPQAIPTGAAQRAGPPARTEAVTRPTPAPAKPIQAAAQAAPPSAGLRWDAGLQENVARAQQALDYLERVASQLEGVKAALAAKLSGSRPGAAELQSRARQLASTLAERATRSGGGVDARLTFQDGQTAQQQFRITGLEVETILQAAPVTLAFSVGTAGGPQLSASFDPGMSAADVVARLDRTLAPVKIRASLDRQQRIVLGTDERNWPAVRENIAISGRGRVNADPIGSDLDVQGIELGNVDALRQSLREVVQALERVRRAQAAASQALSAAAERIVEPQLTPADLTLAAQQVSATAGSHDYDSLLALTSALVGVSRERVLALLGLR